ncbi:MAG: ABC transporter permease [Egibacteraceae bacterium]
MTGVAWRRIVAILALPVLTGLAAALWSAWLGHSTTSTDLADRLSAPSAMHPLGTDEFGRDVLARLVQGAGLSLGLSSAALAGSALLGTALGMAAAWRGGVFGAAAIGGTDAFVALPTVVIALVLVAITGPGITTVLLAVLAVNWTPFARLAYQLTAKVAAAGYVEAAVTLGAGTTRLLVRQVLPNTARPLLAHAFLRFPSILLTVSGLSFLGLGPQPPAPEWGAMLATAQPYLDRAPLLALAPGACIVATGLIVAALGHTLESALTDQDPGRR